MLRLIFRPIQVADLQAGFECIRDNFLYDESAKARLLAMWRDLLERHMAIAACIDDLSETFGRSMVAFGMGVFVQPKFADEIRDGRHPYVAMRLVEMWERGHAPLLNAHEIAVSNSRDGLYMLNLHSGMPQELFASPEAIPILDQNEAFFHYGLSGYRLNEILIEGYGEFEHSLATGMRYSERGSLDEALKAAGITPHPDKHPFIMGLNAAEAAGMRGTLLGALFTYSPPRFRLTVPEQEMLLFALGGNTDEELAKTLCISYPTVRKRWESIYEKVTNVLPVLFDDKAGSVLAKRGSEKRRRVLRYVQFHREELRPYTRTPSHSINNAMDGDR